MAYEWGRLLWWAGQNSPALQALTAVVITFLTAALSVITFYYARLTHRMAVTMEQQMVSAFQPNLSLKITNRGEGQSFTDNVNREDSIFATVVVENKGTGFLKLDSMCMKVVFEDTATPPAVTRANLENLILAPSLDHKERLLADVPPNASKKPHERRIALRCTDLTGFSRHTFVVSDKENGALNHYLGFRNP